MPALPLKRLWRSDSTRWKNDKAISPADLPKVGNFQLAEVGIFALAVTAVPRLCVRTAERCSAFLLAEALPSTSSVADSTALFAGFSVTTASSRRKIRPLSGVEIALLLHPIFNTTSQPTNQSTPVGCRFQDQILTCLSCQRIQCLSSLP